MEYDGLIKHIDCNWLVEIEKSIYRCCDSRSSLHGRELTRAEVEEESCPFFHSKKAAGKVQSNPAREKAPQIEEVNLLSARE